MRHTLIFPTLRAVTVGVLVSQLAFPVAGIGQEMSPQQKAAAKPAMDGDMAQQDADKKGRVEIVPQAAPELSVDNTAVAAAKLPPAARPLTGDSKILMVLDRFTYGARPGDLERVRAMGLQAWFHEQLNPQLIDDSALNERLLQYPAMKKSLDYMFAEFPPQDVVRAMVNERKGGSYGDAGEQAVFRTHVEEYKAKLEEKKNSGKDALSDSTMMAGQSMDGDSKKKDKAAYRAEAEPLPLPIDQILALSPDARYKMVLKFTPGQMRTLYRDMPEEKRGTGALTAGFTPAQIEIMESFRGTSSVIGSEVVQTKLLRDIYSEKQLQEVMVDFWLNHFNVYMKKSETSAVLHR